jgi:hypothetical protein
MQSALTTLTAAASAKSGMVRCQVLRRLRRARAESQQQQRVELQHLARPACRRATQRRLIEDRLDAAHRLHGLARHQHEVGAGRQDRLGCQRPITGVGVDRIRAAGETDDAVSRGVAARRLRRATAHRQQEQHARLAGRRGKFLCELRHVGASAGDHRVGFRRLARQTPDRGDLGDHAVVVVVVGQDEDLDAG